MSPGQPNPLRALIVDDEEPARVELRYRLEELGTPPFSTIDLAATAREAIRHLRSRPYDLVFVDIQMPGLSGLELAELVPDIASHPAVVFVTAYDEYAVQAFELGAADYLMKPVAPERLRRTLERVLGSTVPREPAPPAPAPILDRLPVESAGRTILIDVPEIRFAEARGDVVTVRTKDRRYATRYSLAELERRLPQPPFLRIHRAFVVNLRTVVEIAPYFNGAYLLKVDDDARTELTVSRGHARDLRSLLGF